MLVDSEVTLRKFNREVLDLRALLPVYRKRGWHFLSMEFPNIEVIFTRRVGNIVLVPVAVRINLENFDLWAPSITFIDPDSGEPATPAVQKAIVDTENGPENVLIAEHPITGQPFLCLPGIREYHTHPQHDGDSWLLHRQTGEGRVATLLERVWNSMVKTMAGIATQSVLLVDNNSGNLAAQVNVGLAQGQVVVEQVETNAK